MAEPAVSGLHEGCHPQRLTASDTAAAAAASSSAVYGTVTVTLKRGDQCGEYLLEQQAPEDIEVVLRTLEAGRYLRL